jgi:hypothetical protein
MRPSTPAGFSRSRTSVTSNGSAPPRSTESLTCEPGAPRSSRSATSAAIGRVCRSSIALTRSPGCSPPFAAGEPGRAATTIRNAKRRVSSSPTSASPLAGCCSSLYCSASR